MKDTLLEVKNLRVRYDTDAESIHAVNGISFELKRGETLGLAGETGAGKTTVALSIMGLVPDPPGKIIEGSILFEGQDLLRSSEKDMQKIRGGKISMVFQDPMTSLNPVLTVGDQIMEVLLLHSGLSKAGAARKAQDMLRMVGIPPERAMDYPHQFSGGMKQRVVIAIALACNPSLLIADEPTTALDVTIQAQILELMENLKKEYDTAMILITHDLGVVAEICDRVAIVYAGEIIEIGSIQDIYEDMRHSYTKGLFDSLPDIESDASRLNVIKGKMPDPANLPGGCSFHPRCPRRTDTCSLTFPEFVEVSPGHGVRCHRYR